MTKMEKELIEKLEKACQTEARVTLRLIRKLQKENKELKEKIENEIKELEENEDFYREHNRMYEYEGKISLLKRLLAKE